MDDKEDKLKEGEVDDQYIIDFQNTPLYKKLIELFDEYLLSELQRLAAFKFIKDVFTDTKRQDCNNLKQWLLMKVNNKIHPINVHKMQLGCTDVVPGLRIQPWWDPSEFTWISELVNNFKIIQEELITLREGSGFQPYKSPKYVSEIEVLDNCLFCRVKIR